MLARAAGPMQPIDLAAFIVGQIRHIAKNQALMAETLRRVKDEVRGAAKTLEDERSELAGEVQRLNRELKNAAGRESPARLADIQDRLRMADRRMTEIDDELARLERRMPADREFESAFKLFDPLWETLAPQEQARVIELLVKRVDYDGQKGKVVVTFHDSGLAKLAESLAS